MTYCKNYCEEEGISISKLNKSQKTLYYIAENMKMAKSISEEGYRHFQMAIKALEREPRWIPVSDGLPKDSDEYLVSVIDEYDGNYEAVGTAWFAHKKDYAIAESEWRELGIDEKVVAWMPLPKSYEEKEE